MGDAQVIFVEAANVLSHFLVSQYSQRRCPGGRQPFGTSDRRDTTGILRTRARVDAGRRVVHLTSRNNERLLRLVRSGNFFSTAEFLRADVRDVEVQRVADDIFTLRPVLAVGSGEYALRTAVPGGHDLSVCYGFGIQP
jgi:hypothetical protein